jgi:hypothetical protein
MFETAKSIISADLRVIVAEGAQLPLQTWHIISMRNQAAWAMLNGLL